MVRTLRISLFLAVIATSASQLDAPKPAQALTSLTPYESAVLSDKPNAYYRLDESVAGTIVTNSTTMHDSTTHPAHHNYGKYYSSAPAGITRVAGLTQRGNANDAGTQLSASGWAATPNYAELRFTGPMSIEAWAGWPKQPAGVIASFGDASRAPYDNYKLGYNARTNHLSFQLALSGVAYTLEAVTPKPNTIYHIVGTFDGAVARFYVNGVLRDARIMSGAQTYTSTTPGLTIGNDSTHRNASSVIVDEVALYPTALSAVRVAAHYMTGSPLAPYSVSILGATYLGSLPALNSAHAMNQLGQIAGYTQDGSYNSHAAVFSGTTVIPVGPPVAGLTATAINDRGDVLVTSPYGAASRASYVCSIYHAGCTMLRPLASLPVGRGQSCKFSADTSDLNNFGIVSGVTYAVASTTCNAPNTSGYLPQAATRWSAAGVPGAVYNVQAYSYADSINDAGVIGGGLNTGYVLFAPGGTTTQVPWQPQVLANSGDILAPTYGSISGEVVLHRGSTFPVPAPAGCADTTPVAMNRYDEVVSDSSCATNIATIAVVGAGPAIDLNTLIPAGGDVALYDAAAINDRGQIAAVALVGPPAGAQPNRVVLLTPNAP